MPLTEKIRTALRDSGATQHQIATESGTSERAVSNFIAGRNVNSDTLDKFAEWIGIDVLMPKKKTSPKITKVD